jgi:carboxymethylenebutenolidase
LSFATDGWLSSHATNALAVASFHGGGLVTESPNSPHLQASKTKAQFLIAVASNDDQKSPNEKNILK